MDNEEVNNGNDASQTFNNPIKAIRSRMDEDKSVRYLVYTFLILFGFLVFLQIVKFFSLNSVNPQVNYMRHFIIVVYSASYLILVSVGLTLVTRVRKFANFAHSELVIIGIYTAIAIDEWMVNHPDQYGENFIFSILFVRMILAFIVAGIAGLLSELLVFGPLVKRDATPLSLLVASIGIGIVIRQVIQEIYGAVPRTSRLNYPTSFDKMGDNLLNIATNVENASIPLISGFFSTVLKLIAAFFTDIRMQISNGSRTMDVFLSRDEMWAFAVMVITVLVLRLIFTKTTLGISMRATADDIDLAQITGINTQAVIYWTWFIAGGVTGMGALFLFSSSQIQPGSGFLQLLLIFAVVTLGGFDSFEGTLVSGFIVATSMSATVIINSKFIRLKRDSEFWDTVVFWSTSGDWKLSFPFAIIIVVLFVRPRGIFGLVDPRSKL